MRLAYITRVLVNTKDAQSIQITQMVQEFINALGKEKFVFYNYSDFQHKYGRNGNFLLNLRVVKLILCLCYYVRCVRREAKYVDSIVFTRDVVAVLMCKILGVRCAYEAHHLFESNISSLVFQFVKNYDKLKIIYISEGVKIKNKKKYSFSCSAFVAHDGYNPVNSVKHRETLSKFQDLKNNFDKIVVHCGKLDYSKGVDIFFKMAASFPRIAFVQVGGFRNEKDRELYNTSGIGANISVIDDIENIYVPNILATSDFLFFPMSQRNKYWRHTSPLKLFEYFGSGVPIIGSFIGSVVEITKKFDIPEFQPDNVDDAIIVFGEMLKNYTENKIKAEENKKYAERHFTWQKRVSNIIEWLS